MAAPSPAAERGLASTDAEASARPWPALWALVIGFFMILIDTTIVSVATPAIMTGLHADINAVVWVSSAYLLSYAVPLLITGRLGDRYGPKTLYLVGLALFTLSSLWCGLSGTIGVLITARVLQGLGAAMMTPQTMAVITRTFPPERRGAAMGMWGSVAGAATLIGPILGGVLIDSLGWEWIFFVNVPIGVIGFVAAMILVPKLPTHTHRFDIAGVVLSAVAMFLLVFGIQEGETYDWGTITGPISVWSLIIAGLVVLLGFLWWQHRQRDAEPLLPLRLFLDRNFSLANVAITAMGFVVTGMGFPLMLYAQVARGLSPTRAALLMIPMAVLSMALAPLVGMAINRRDARLFAIPGFVLLPAALVIYDLLMQPQFSVLWLLVPAAVLGMANSCIWGPLSVTATRNLAVRDAGAGSGVYNTTRQVGAVLGSAAIAAIMQARIIANLPPGAAGHLDRAGSARIPAFLEAGFSTAMGQSVLLPAAAAVVGLLAVIFFARPYARTRPARSEARHAADSRPALVRD